MKYSCLSEDGKQRYNAEAGADRGAYVVGEDRIVRWLTDDELRAMTGVGVYDPESGYCVYEDTYEAQKARLA